jgi:gentisate 1,2-dioxygenase
MANAPFLSSQWKNPVFDNPLKDAQDALALIGNAEWFEYSKAANPIRPSLSPQVPAQAFLPDLYADCPTRLIPLDLSKKPRCSGPATSPVLCANFARILPGETLSPDIGADAATSQVFYVIRGSGRTRTLGNGSVLAWKKNDVVALPGGAAYRHEAGPDGAALYLVHDAPMLRHLGVSVTSRKFEPVVYPAGETLAVLDQVAKSPQAADRSRISVLLANKQFPQLRTITHVIWTMYGIVQPGSMQAPHRHQSVALDFIPACGPGCYTLLGRDIDPNGNIIKPVRLDWVAGMAFVTPPGFWHAHFNEGDQPNYVLPMQDAGLQTYLRSLDIRFAGGTHSLKAVA